MVNTQKFCDLVMEGGGVKGIGLVGALEVLNNEGYRVRRVAGTSAGAIIGSLVAAGMPIQSLREQMGTLDYRKFRDEGLIDRLSVAGKGLSLWFEKGIYEGKFLTEWLSVELAKLGVVTFGDLKITEPWAQDLPPEQRYKLVVVVADITRGRLVRFPWDYDQYGLDRDKQRVADAVRASMSIPFFYEPVKIDNSFLVDGGTLSNFPIDLFDSTGDWPTFGLKLSAKPDANLVANPVDNTIDFGRAILETMLNAHDQMHLDDPCVQDRTMFIDTLKIKTTNFDITSQEQQQLYLSGKRAAKRFFDDWSFSKHQKICGKKH